MTSTKIFIASSAELEEDRKAFRELLSVENDKLHYKGVYLELVQWEYFLDSVSSTSKQDDYNRGLAECQIVICLFYTKAGKYTQLEFDTALKLFKEKGSPLIYTYFKEPEIKEANVITPIAGSKEESQQQELLSFKKRLSELGHFYTRYKSIEDLKYQLLLQLDLLKEKGIIQLQEDVKKASMPAVVNYINTINASNQQAQKINNIGSITGNVSL
jgi:hypothetical protein